MAVSGHTGNFASACAPRQTSLALRCALAMVIAIKISLLEKNFTSKILSGKSYNCLVFTARKKVPRKTSGINSSNSSF